MITTELSTIGASVLRLQQTSSGAVSPGDRAAPESTRQIDQYLTISGDASWIAISDQVSRGVELTALVQIRNDALDELGALLVDMRALASSRDQGLDVATELDEKEREISLLIGANILALPKETVFMSSDADPSDLLAIDEINYFGNLKVHDGLTNSIIDVA